MCIPIYLRGATNETISYKEFDIATGIVFTNLCIDLKQRFGIDSYNDPKAVRIFELLTDYIASNAEIKEEYDNE